MRVAGVKTNSLKDVIVISASLVILVFNDGEDDGGDKGAKE